MSGLSILTNSGAQVALANLGVVESQLGAVQKKISTGQQIADATDNAAVFAVAQGIRANLQAYNAVNTGLNDAQALIQTALAATTSISNLIPQITATLIQLSDGSLNDQQRQVYTASLKTQVDEVQSFINAANYDGANLISAQQGTQGIDYSNYSSPANMAVEADIYGNSLLVSGLNLTGGTLGTDGFLGLSRLVYLVGNSNTMTASNAGFGRFYVASISGMAFVLLQQTYYAYQLGDRNNFNGVFTGTNAFVSRPEVYSYEAIAALGAISNIGSLYQYPYFAYFNGTTAPPVQSNQFFTSVFDADLALFAQKVNSTLGSLGASANNIQLQLTFNQSIANSLNTGLGNLVDADLAQASAQLTALQTQRQLAVQTLSIANAQPNVILSLFH